jgi:hypothetical protein
MIVIGQAIAGMGSPFVGYGIAGFAATWYIGPGRGVVVSILSIMAALGNIGGFLLPFLFIEPKNSNSVIKAQIYKYLMMHLIVAGLCFLLTIFLFKENENTGLKSTADSDENKKIPMTV